VQVLHHQDQGLTLCRVQHQMPQQRKGPGLPRRWTELCQARWRHREVQELQQQGNVGLCG
jgi:hypothetical protein